MHSVLVLCVLWMACIEKQILLSLFFFVAILFSIYLRYRRLAKISSRMIKKDPRDTFPRALLNIGGVELQMYVVQLQKE